MVNISNTPSSALRAWVVRVRISNRGSLVEFKVVQGFFKVSFRQEVKFFVDDTFVENEAFIVEGSCVDEGKF